MSDKFRGATDREEVPVENPRTIKLYVYDLPEEVLYLRNWYAIADYYCFLEQERGRWPDLYLSAESVTAHYFSEAMAEDWTQQYVYDFFLYDRLRQAGWTTRDAAEADFFLIPNLATTLYALLLKDVEDMDFNSSEFIHQYLPRLRRIMDQYVNDLLNYIHAHHATFDRRRRDHLFVCTWDNGIGVCEPVGTNLYPGNMLGNTPRSRLRDVIRIQYFADRAAGRTIVIPPLLGGHAVRTVLSDPRSRNFSAEQRSVLAFFRGATSHHWTRQALHSRYGDDREMLVNTPEMEGPGFDDVRWSSRFSICLEGVTAWTMRLPQAFLYGCIPVFLTDDVVLPFAHQINWDECALRLSPQVIPELKSVLQALPAAEVERLQRGVVKYAAAIVPDWDRFNELGAGAMLRAELARLKAASTRE